MAPTHNAKILLVDILIIMLDKNKFIEKGNRLIYPYEGSAKKNCLCSW